MSESKKRVWYEYREDKDALGVVVSFKGPGLPMYANKVHFLQTLNSWAQECLEKDEKNLHEEQRMQWQHEAKTVIALIEAAHEAGRESAFRDIRCLLGVKGSSDR